jgi:hypothetical protein
MSTVRSCSRWLLSSHCSGPTYYESQWPTSPAGGNRRNKEDRCVEFQAAITTKDIAYVNEAYSSISGPNLEERKRAFCVLFETAIVYVYTDALV